MANLQQALDSIRDRIENAPKPKVKQTPKPKETSLFSDEEAKKLEREMLGLDVIYKEPNFKKSYSPTQNELVVEVEQNTQVLTLLTKIQVSLDALDKKIETPKIKKEPKISNTKEEAIPYELVKMMISELDDISTAKYQLQTKNGIKEIDLEQYYEISKFITMLKHYKYSLTIDKNLDFEDKNFNLYKDKLNLISQNLLANSFRFFEKSKIISEVIDIGKKIKSDFKLSKIAINDVEDMLSQIDKAVKQEEYKKQYFFSKLLNEKGLILNSITIINEMLGEYIIESSKNLSAVSKDRIQNYIDHISLKSSSRKAYYKFHKSVKDFFRTNFTDEQSLVSLAFFPHKDSANEEIKNKMHKLYKANKMNKKNYFIDYSNLIDNVRIIRNDLAHGNIGKVHKDIGVTIDEILTDFNYLAIEKDFLKKQV